jgi:hypothetical protein
MARAIGIGQDGNGAEAAHDFEPLPIIGSERRLHVRAYHYWRALADDRPMPTLADCADLGETGFASKMILIDLAKGQKPARIRSVGEDLVAEMPSAESTGSGLVDELLARLPTVAMQRAPIGFEAETPEGEEAGRCFRGILLPIADDDGAIAHVLGVMSWRHFAAEIAGREIFAAVASLPTAPRMAEIVSPWSTAPVMHEMPVAPTAGERLLSAQTWKALASMDRTQSQTHLHAAVGAAYDAVADLSEDEGKALLASIFDQGPELVLIERVIAQARLLAIGGQDLARRLDAASGGMTDFVEQGANMPEPVTTPARMHFRLAPLGSDLLVSPPRRDREDRDLPARRASR